MVKKYYKTEHLDKYSRNRKKNYNIASLQRIAYCSN